MSENTHKCCQYALRLAEVPEHRIQECLHLLNELEDTSTSRFELGDKSLLVWTKYDIQNPRNVMHLRFTVGVLDYYLFVSSDVRQFYTEVGLDQFKQIIATNQLKHIVMQ